ncbi:MAG: hypothetical protein CFE33_06460 [Pseudorhodobacter sp. PARRP1]|nr:MAG: hypothetical protein CFE33_06460 [Pseudorhodobacter sp. PARRP1]
MQAMSARSARIRGVVVLICGLPLLALGLWLLWIVLARPLPDWLPEAIKPGAGLRIEGLDASSSDADRLRSLPGIGSLFLLLFGTIATLQGLVMLLLGRRSMALLALMAVMLVGMVVFGWSV